MPDAHRLQMAALPETDFPHARGLPLSYRSGDIRVLIQIRMVILPTFPRWSAAQTRFRSRSVYPIQTPYHAQIHAVPYHTSCPSCGTTYRLHFLQTGTGQVKFCPVFRICTPHIFRPGFLFDQRFQLRTVRINLDADLIIFQTISCHR